MNTELVGELGQFAMLETGKRADIAVVDSDPLADTKVLSYQDAIRRVVRKGDWFIPLPGVSVKRAQIESALARVLHDWYRILGKAERPPIARV